VWLEGMGYLCCKDAALLTLSHLALRNPTIKLPEFARSEMSQTLLRDLTAHLYSAVLHSLPMLKGLDERTLTEVALALEPIQLAPNSVIYREDELADCMYFLSEGTIEMSILLIPSARKADLGLHIIADTAVRDTMVETDGGAANKPRQVIPALNPSLRFLSLLHPHPPPPPPPPPTSIFGLSNSPNFCYPSTLGHFSTLTMGRICLQYKMKRDRSMNVIDWAQNTAISSNRMPDDWSPRVFKWHIDHSRSQTFFGEGALTSRSPLRKASAVALTWCTLFRLDRDVLKRIASKSKQMDRLYRHVIAKLLDDTPCHSMSHT
jgi:CRP-like cAMP-binding protein